MKRLPVSTWRSIAGAAVGGAIVACAIVAVAEGFANIRPFKHFTCRPWKEAGTDRFSEMGRRYLPLRDRLRGMASAGFVSSFDHEMGHRMMAQSLVAPTLLIDSDKPAVLVASFESDAELEEYLRGKPFKVRERLGAGVAILAREGP